MKLTLLDNSINLIELPSGISKIGNNHSLPEEAPEHQITIRNGLFLSDSAITYKIFYQFIKDTSYKTQAERDGGSKIIENGQLVFQNNLNWKNSFSELETPVTCISYEDTQQFCQWITNKEITSKTILPTDTIRLPTEKEWEHAARCNSNIAELKINQIAWYADNAEGHPHQVKTKSPNQWGYYDLLGNVSEWTKSDFNSYSKENTNTELFINNQNLKVIRGGSWASPIDKISVTMRGRATINSHCNYSGFRILLEETESLPIH